MNPTCDECRKQYDWPAYYTFPLYSDEHGVGPHGETCTGNLCPNCAGALLEPDDVNDPRRPKND